MATLRIDWSYVAYHSKIFKIYLFIFAMSEYIWFPPPQAVKYFEALIGKNVYAMFFFAGHGFEHNSKNYMMPVDADVEKNPEQCICAQQVLHTMQAKGAKLSIVLLDMCRINASSAYVQLVLLLVYTLIG